MIRTLLEEFVVPLLLFLLVRSLLKGWFGYHAARPLRRAVQWSKCPPLQN